MKKNLILVISLTLFPLLNLAGCGLKPEASRSTEAPVERWIVKPNFSSDPSDISSRVVEYRNFINHNLNGSAAADQIGVDVNLTRHQISTNHLVVKFRDQDTERAVQTAFASEEGSRKEKRERLHQFKASGAKLVPIPDGNSQQQVLAYIGALRELAGVEYVYPDYRVSTLTTPTDLLFNKQQGLKNIGQTTNYTRGANDADIDAPEAWEVSTGSKGVVVAVVDSGIDYNHPDLADNIWTNSGEMGTDSNGLDKSANGIDDDGNGYTDDFRGWDFVDNDNDPMDTNGHGTHVAGIIGASGNNGRGIAGVNWRVSLVPLRILDTLGQGETSSAVKALEYATQMGFHIVNNSYAGGAFDQNMEDAISEARDQDVLFVAAAGNEGSNNDNTPIYPASYNLDNVLVVGASDKSDNLAYFSNYGLTSVDLVAPGEDILSTYLNKTYRYLSGTSMAAPHVSGAAALLSSKTPSMTFSQLKTTLTTSVDSFSHFQTKIASSGRLNLARAIGGTPDSAPTSSSPVVLGVTPTAGPLAGGSTITILGSGFQSGARVLVGYRVCADVNVVDQSEIHCTIPASGAGSVTVSVINSNGELGSKESAYLYRSAPKLFSITPSRTSVISVGSGKVLWLQGSGFVSGAQVNIGNQLCTSPTIVGESLVLCDLPITLTAGSYSVTLTNLEGQVSNQAMLEVVNVTAHWVSTPGSSCNYVCKQEGLESKPSPEGAYCTSGKLIAASAIAAGINYTKGCAPNTSCQVAQGAVSGASSQGRYCYSSNLLRKFQATDITMGCFCGL